MQPRILFDMSDNYNASNWQLLLKRVRASHRDITVERVLRTVRIANARY